MPRLRSLLIIFTFSAILFPAVALAQGYKISGRIVDAETLDPMPYAHVFIDQTTLGAVSDINGEYVIEHVEPGQYRLVFTYVGYELFSKPVEVNGADVRLSARLVPQLEMLQNIEVKGTKDKEWEAQVKKFHHVFFGDTEWARDCKILNPWALEFSYDPLNKKTSATASEPLQIENKALGYNIVCNLLVFTYDKKSYKIKGHYKFEEINTLDAREAARWTRNRKQTYQNSLRFLMRSIIENHERENGFNLYLDNRPEKYSTSSFIAELGKNLVTFEPGQHLTPLGAGAYKLSLSKRIEVHHTTQFAKNKIYTDVPHPISWIEAEQGFIIINQDGYIQNNDKIITMGELNNVRIAGMLPSNYSPGSLVVVNYLTKRNIAKRLQERVYIQPDKTTYYAGETIWFKAHLNYANPSVRDSLSTVLYVDVFRGDSILKSIKLKIDSLGASGCVLIPAEWQPGAYALRAYSRWMQNYGSDILSYTPIHILPSNKKLIYQKEVIAPPAGDFLIDTISMDDDSLTFDLMLDSAIHTDWASCAISVAPVAMGTFNQSANLKQALYFPEDLPDGTLGDFVFRLEYSFSLSGRVKNHKNKSTQATMTILSSTLDSIYVFKTSRKGTFEIKDLNFYDTARFSFQARDKKGRIFGQTELIDPIRPALPKGKRIFYSVFDTVTLHNPIQLINKKTDSLYMTDTKPKASQLTILSNADYILTEDDLNKMPGSQNILTALTGRIPGLQYSSVSQTVRFGTVNTSSQENNEVLFVIDGIPIYSIKETKAATDKTRTQTRDVSSSQTSNTHQTSRESQSSELNQNSASLSPGSTSTQSTSPAVDMLSQLTVSEISRVEVNKGMDPRYGAMGSGGSIYITTKRVQNKVNPHKTFDMFTLSGYEKTHAYTRAENFNSKDPENYLPTLYWNPSLTLLPKRAIQISFPAPEGNERYRLTISGVTRGGVPVFSEHYIGHKKDKRISANLDPH